MSNIRRFAGKRFILCLLILAVAAFFCASQPSYAASKKPSKVKNIKVMQITYDSVTIKWNASRYAKKYEVYRASKKKGKYKKVGTVKVPRFTNAKLATGTAYWYKVRAVNGKKKGAYSGRLKAVPAMARVKLAITSSGDGPLLRITPVQGAAGYHIFRDGKLIRTQSVTAFTDMYVAAGTSHSYRVDAWRKVGKKTVLSPASSTLRASKLRPQVKLNGARMVPTLKAGETFDLTGTITSNATIRRLEIGIVNGASNTWVNGAKYDNPAVNAKSFPMLRADNAVRFGILGAGNYRYRIYAHLADGTLITVLNHTFKVKSNTPGADAICAMARRCAWPYGTSRATYKYPSGRRTQAYTNALQTAYGSRNTWGAQTKAGASCDVFVGTVVRASGFDKKFPRGLDGIQKHISKHRDKWTEINMPDKSQLRHGDVLFQIYKGGGGHVMIYLGDGKVANAHYNGKTYGIIQSYSSQVHLKSGCRIFKAYRPRN